MARGQTTIVGQSPDYLLMGIVAVLIIIGLIMVYSATYVLGLETFDRADHFLVRQAIWVALGTVVLLVMTRLEYHNWQRVSVLGMGTILFLLVMLLVVGGSKFGSRRWFFNGSVQPSELAKLVVIIYIADWLSSKGDQIRQVTYGLIPFAVLLGVVTGLIVLQPDFSTAILIVATAVAMFFVAGADLLQLAIGFVFGGGALAFLLVQAPYRAERLQHFWNPLEDPLGRGFQAVQALIALRRGGFIGLGLGASQQKLGYLPASHTDTIFAILGEELGLIGCLLVVGLFVALAYRGFRIALNAPDAFGTVLASGVTFWLVFQALINVAVVTATMPFTGIPLPFVSFGGSALVASMAGIGLLLSVSRRTVPIDTGEYASFNFSWRYGRARLSRRRRRQRVAS